MLIRSNSLSEATKARLMNGAALPDYLGPMGTAKTSTPTPRQNIYENVFVKLFAQSALYLITVFGLLFALVSVLREIIGFKLGFLKISFWCQVGFNLAIFSLLNFARVKVLTNSINLSSIPLESIFTYDHLVLLAVWKIALWCFGCWYLRQYASKLFVMFSPIVKGKVPVLKEEYFLLAAALSFQGLVSWVLALRAGELKYRPHQKHAHLAPFHHVLLSKFRSSRFWIKLAKQSALIYPILLAIHLFFSWFAFPIYGRIIASIFPVQQPIRHSWFILFRFSVLFHAFGVSFLINLFNKLSALCIDHFLSAPNLHASTLVANSEHCLTVGVTQSRHPFIHLSALYELQSLMQGTDSTRRRKLFAAVEEEGSLSREICEWFIAEFSNLVQHAETDLKELIALEAELSGSNGNNASATEAQRVFISNKQWVEKISKRFFPSTGSSSAEVAAAPALVPIPEIFAKRGTSAPTVTTTPPAPLKPLILDFAPLLKKHVLGRRLLAYWVVSRKTHCISRFNCIVNAIGLCGKFVACSFEEDITGQVQMILPRILEASVSALKVLRSLEAVKFSFDVAIEEEADSRLVLVMGAIKESLRVIVDTFGTTFEDVRISGQTRELIKQFLQ